MVGRLVSIWEGLFSASMLVLRRVFLIEMFAKVCAPCYTLLCFLCFLQVGDSLLECFFGCDASELFYVWIGSIALFTMQLSNTYTSIFHFHLKIPVVLWCIYIYIFFLGFLLASWNTDTLEAKTYTPPKTNMDTQKYAHLKGDTF